MLNGKELGVAIGKAIRLKVESGAVRSKAEIARHFGVKPPSLADWVNKGSISKDKLPEVWRFFSDVVGCSHWGLSEAEWPLGLSSTNVDSDLKASILQMPESPEILVVATLMRAMTATGRQRVVDFAQGVSTTHRADRQANGAQ